MAIIYEDDKSDLIDLTIVIPLFNEEASIKILYEKLSNVLRQIGKSYEIIFVDDGSRDSTYSLVLNIQRQDPQIKILKLKRNFGQTSALAAGIDFSSGKIIITMDGDLQHDPAEIPLFLKELDKGFDIVCSWRKNRKDPFFSRVLPSKMANFIIRLISGVKVHDFGGTFRAYRREIIKKVELFGDAHRFIPALSSDLGASVSEVVIKSIPREFGHSHYGISRTFGVILDLILLRFLLGFVRRPIKFFGFLGLAALGIGVSISLVLLLLWLLTIIPHLREHIAMLILSVFLMMTGIQFLSIGILAELIARIYFASRNKKTYEIT